MVGRGFISSPLSIIVVLRTGKGIVALLFLTGSTPPLQRTMGLERSVLPGAVEHGRLNLLRQLLRLPADLIQLAQQIFHLLGSQFHGAGIGGLGERGERRRVGRPRGFASKAEQDGGGEVEIDERRLALRLALRAAGISRNAFHRGGRGGRTATGFV